MIALFRGVGTRTQVRLRLGSAVCSAEAFSGAPSLAAEEGRLGHCNPGVWRLSSEQDQNVDSRTEQDEPPPQRRPHSQAMTFRVVWSPDESSVGRGVLLDSERVLQVGREERDGTLNVGDPKLSRLHFRVVWDNRSASYRIGDAHSANGTFVNGARIDSVVLISGDVVRAGQSLFVLASANQDCSLEARIEAVARSPLPALLLGESGVGKEVAAQALHERSGRPGAFVPVNCAALPKDLAAAELFGHTKAAFSGAGGARVGLFQAATRGTLFLDELGELPLGLQPILLRALQDGKVRPVGSDREEQVDVRVVAATNAKLDLAVGAGRFRGDLYARIAQHVVRIPPLRERRVELIGIARRLIETVSLTADAAEALLLWDYPYNVRELKSVLVRCAEQTKSAAVTLGVLERVAPELAHRWLERRDAARASSELPIKNTRPTRHQLAALLDEHGGNVSAVAAALNTSRTQLYRWFKEYGLGRTRD
jgi:transcriptional regulator of acetoin/glycerol metabolism